MQHLFKNLFKLSLAVIFTVSAIMSIVSVWQLGSAGLKFALGVSDYCTYPVKEEPTTPVCTVDYNSLKRDLADNVALMVVAVPVSIFLYRKLNG